MLKSGERVIHIVSAALHGGQPNTGVRFGPSLIRRRLPQTTTMRHTRVMAKDEDDIWCQLQNLKHHLDDVHRNAQVGDGPPDPVLVLGGDHSVGMASVRATRNRHPEARVLWIDAHPDLHTPMTSESQNVHGMAVGMLTCQAGASRRELVCIEPAHLAFLGLRSVDPAERAWFGVHRNVAKFSADELNSNTDRVLSEVEEFVSNHPVHVSFDIDVLDPTLAPATGTPVPGGLLLPELEATIDKLRSLNIVTLDIVEVDPCLRGGEKTAELAGDIASDILWGTRRISSRREKSEAGL